MNLKLYTRPYSAKSQKKISPVGIQSPCISSSRFHTTASEFYTHDPLFSSTIQESNLKSQNTIGTPCEDSTYKLNLNFPARPSSSHLSGLTVQENQRTLSQTQSLNKLLIQSSSRFLPHGQSTTMPSEDDFSKIITKLDMVSTNRTAGTRRIMLNEGDKIEILMESGETQYFSINSKNKKPPMVVTVKLSKGRVISYASKVHAEPSKDICEVSSRNETFQVKDVSIKFRIDAIYVGVEAITDCVFTLSASFGQPMSMRSSKSLRVTQEEREIIEKPEREWQPRKKKKVNVGKDFVKINMERLKKNVSEGPETGKKWDFKKESVRIRKRQIMENKRQRTLLMINKKTRTGVNCKVDSQVLQFWTGLIVFAKSIKYLASRVCNN